jgi:hypothetical protein
MKGILVYKFGCHSYPTFYEVIFALAIFNLSGKVQNSKEAL